MRPYAICIIRIIFVTQRILQIPVPMSLGLVIPMFFLEFVEDLRTITSSRVTSDLNRKAGLNFGKR